MAFGIQCNEIRNAVQWNPESSVMEARIPEFSVMESRIQCNGIWNPV